MSGWRRWFADERSLAPERDVSALRPGAAALLGTIEAERPLSSPLRSRACAAFYYKATYLANSRLKGHIRRKLLDTLVYAEGLSLRLEAGSERITLVPPACEPFVREQHLALKARGFHGFDAREQVIRQGAEAIVRGRLRRADDGWTLAISSLELPKEPSA